jgi:acetylornithine deacetylase/succinyl-diaminopimelate desuccinylase-like protein
MTRRLTKDEKWNYGFTASKEFSNVIKNWTRLEADRNITDDMSVDEIAQQLKKNFSADQIIRDSEDTIKSKIMHWSDEEVFINEEVLNALVPLLSWTLEIVTETARERRRTAKLKSR